MSEVIKDWHADGSNMCVVAVQDGDGNYRFHWGISGEPRKPTVNLHSPDVLDALALWWLKKNPHLLKED